MTQTVFPDLRYTQYRVTLDYFRGEPIFFIEGKLPKKWLSKEKWERIKSFDEIKEAQRVMGELVFEKLSYLAEKVKESQEKLNEKQYLENRD